MIKRFFIVALALSVSAVANAGHIGNVTIDKIRVHNTFAIVWTVEKINIASCADAATDRTFIVPLDETHGSNRVYATLLSAHAQNKPVNPDCEATCLNFGWLGGNVTQCKNMTID